MRGRGWIVAGGLLLPIVAALLTAGPTTYAGISDPKTGRYAGVGENGLRIGLNVTMPDMTEVESPVYALVNGTCSASGDFLTAVSDLVDSSGRYRMDIDGMTSDTSIRGRFRTSKSATGKVVYEQTDPMLCPGTYEYRYTLGRVASIPKTGGANHKPKDGRYAGGRGETMVWFDVEDGMVSNGRIHAEFPSCGKTVGIGDDDAKPDSDGFFSFQDVNPPDNVFFRGRFKTPRRVTGKVVWSTTSSCPAGSYEFNYRARRFKVPG